MDQSLRQQKEFLKKELQQQCRKIEEVLKEVMPHIDFNNLSMKNDIELKMRCDHVHAIAIGAKEMECFGITQVTLMHFHSLAMSFSVLLEDINEKTA